MKRFFLAVSMVMLSGTLYAAGTPSVWRSSFTKTADTAQNVCGNSAGIVTNRRGFFHGVCVSSPTAANGVFTVYNSSAVSSNVLAEVDTNARGCYYYDVLATTGTKGLTYSNSSTASVNLLYDCY